MNFSSDWPILKEYGRAHLRRIAMPLGGLGTGCVSLGGRGDLRDFEIMNRPAKKFVPQRAVFVARCKAEGEDPIARVLEGPLDDEVYEGSFGSVAPHHGWPRFRENTFEAAYPFGQVVLRDEEMPINARLQAFNPLIPGDADASGWPVATLRYIIKNTRDVPLEVSLCGVLSNFIGHDGLHGKPCRNRNEWRESDAGKSGGIRGIFMSSSGISSQSEQFGTIALTTTHADTTHRIAWPTPGWNGEQREFWDDLLDDGRIEYSNEWGKEGAELDSPTASLCAHFALGAGETRAITFLLSWHFLNRMSWTPAANGGYSLHVGNGAFEVGEPIVGNFYTTKWRDAWHVAEEFAPQQRVLETQSLQFVNAFLGSDLPEVVKEAALFNLSTLKTQTVFRTPDGNFYGWEGVHDHYGSCHGNCTHVWNYETATPFLFAQMSRSMRELEFEYSTDERGSMSFRVSLPLEKMRSGNAAADGQMGCLVKLWRDWQLNGDDEWLRRLWPSARRALEFCWLDGGWDSDCDGVMEGCQHNTMDVEYYGPNPQMQGWYLAALRATEKMARYLGEDDFAERCRLLFERGRTWTEANLWNGEYYEHHVIVPEAEPDSSTRHSGPLPRDEEPKWQLGSGCLIDQLVGQYASKTCGLGDVFDAEHVRECLHNIVKFNRRETMRGHFNHMRSYALGDESALLMATYPRGRRPKFPFPYWSEVMTGFEYVVAVEFLQEGEIDAGIALISDIRARYDGYKRNPFSEAECGHHYARAMASWSAVLALSGFEYSKVSGTLTFGGANARNANARNAIANDANAKRHDFWSNGTAWGTFVQTPQDDGIATELEVLFGILEAEELVLSGVGTARFPVRRIEAGEKISLVVLRDSPLTIQLS